MLKGKTKWRREWELKQKQRPRWRRKKRRIDGQKIQREQPTVKMTELMKKYNCYEKT